jgi:predicted NUDIX family NTP pyrophosphohydrolase
VNKKSAGILAYRFNRSVLEVFLVHPGGPFWEKRDKGVWSIPKGEFTDEEPLQAALREFGEETGVHVEGNFQQLTPIKQKSGKVIYIFALETDNPILEITSNLFEMEWPPHSGIKQKFPEVDKGGWFTIVEALQKIVPGQAGFILELQRKLEG